VILETDSQKVILETLARLIVSPIHEEVVEAKKDAKPKGTASATATHDLWVIAGKLRQQRKIREKNLGQRPKNPSK
jgi:hypothetical protein